MLTEVVRNGVARRVEVEAGRRVRFCPSQRCSPAAGRSQSGHNPLKFARLVTDVKVIPAMPLPSTLLEGPKILVVDDEEAQRCACTLALQKAGYRVVQATDGLDALDAAARERPDCILLDVDMPRLDGWRALEQLRARGVTTPVLMLTGLVDINSRVRGLGAGADDYLGKPCDHRELLARVHALLRRAQPARPVLVLNFGPLRIDVEQRFVTIAAGTPPALTRTEFALLELLARHAGRTVPRETILDDVWGYAPDTVTRTVETHIWRLRRKLGDDAAQPRWIRTVQGAGYRLEASVVAPAAVAASA